MTAPERFADSQIPLAPRAPSIHVSRQSAPRLIGDATAALASLCRPQTICETVFTCLARPAGSHGFHPPLPYGRVMISSR